MSSGGCRAQVIKLSATVDRSAVPLALRSDASCCCCWGTRSRQERSADDGATSQQGAAFGVPLSSTYPGASPLFDLASLTLSLSAGSATLVGFSERPKLFIPRCF